MPKRSSSEDSDVGSAFAALQHVIDQTEAPSDDLARLKARIAELERVCDEMYSFASLAQAPPRILQFLDAARSGRPITGSILPITDADFKTSTGTTAADAGRKGGLKGGRARAANLSQRRLTAIAKKAAKARWKDK